MKINYLFFLIFLFSNSLEAGKLKINVVNLDQKVGLIHFALYNKPDLFPEKKGKIFGLAKNAKEIFDKRKPNYIITGNGGDFYSEILI